MIRHFVFYFVFSFQLLFVNTFNIISIVPASTASHFNIYQAILKGLAEKGHNVTVMSHYPPDYNHKNYKFFPLGDPEFVTKLVKNFTLFDLDNSDPTTRKSRYAEFFFMEFLGLESCKVMIQSKPVRQLLEGDNKFDIALLEHFSSDCSLAVVKKYNCSVVRLHSTMLFPWTGTRHGYPSNPSYIPNTQLWFSDRMTFFERLENTVVTTIQSLYFNNIVLYRNNELVGHYFGKEAKTLFQDIYRDSLLLVNSHYSLTFPRPMLPNIIEIGGVHLKNLNPLPPVSYNFTIIFNFKIIK